MCGEAAGVGASDHKVRVMKVAWVTRNVGRTLLLVHFVGLAMSVGTRLADLVIEHATSGPDLHSLSLGRDLTAVLARSLVLPGFLLLLGSGVGLTLLRYGARPPGWIWIKVALNSVGIFVAMSLVAPALQAARVWAQWSVAHDQLAPQFQADAAQASFYGAIVFALFLLSIPVAIWKPHLARKLPLGAPGRS
jgi:hypothetical protein